jgi:hypothetical protein
VASKAINGVGFVGEKMGERKGRGWWFPVLGGSGGSRIDLKGGLATKLKL